MKNSTLVLLILLFLFSCKGDSTSEEKTTIQRQETKTTTNTLKPTEKQEKQITVAEKEPEVKEDTPESLAKAEVERLFQLSGIPKEEYQEKLDNPETLNQLIKDVEKNKKDADRQVLQLKADIPLEQLTSKKTSTGVSIEEAILITYDDLKGKNIDLKSMVIDSVSGTKIMSGLSKRNARKVFEYVHDKENERLSPITLKSRFIHSVKELDEHKNTLESMLADYDNGKVIASGNYKTKLKRSLLVLKNVAKKIRVRAKEIQEEFKKLNPDLYFGDDVGETFFGNRINTAVYLPLGKLSFADTVLRAHHPKLNVNELSNVLGAPNSVEDEPADIITGIYSLGKKGSLTVKFTDNALTNVNGPDLYIFEIGVVEPTNLEISKDGISWIQVGKIDGGVSQVDIDAFVEPGDLFYYVRLTDLEQPSGLPGADVDAIAAIGAAMRLKLDSKVLFETGKSELKPEGIAAIKELAESIAVLKKGKVIVEGHTDDVGKDSYNQKLSLARSASVVAELKKQIPGNKFTWMERGMGESKPLVENDSDENRAKNRRVEILVVPNQK